MATIEPADTYPEWIDERLSRQLSALRQKGEGQYLEYKQEFPRDVHKIGKEMAAFATSGGGRILIGIDDDGNLRGQNGLDEVSTRDELKKRIEGIPISPPLTPIVAFAREDTFTVVVIQIHKGKHPVYYCGDKPYIRHLTASRPAKPDEVIERVSAWLGVGRTEDGISMDVVAERYWKQHLDVILLELIIAMDEAPYLHFDEGLDRLEFVLGSSAESLHDIVTSYLANEPMVADSLKDLAVQCDKMIYALSSRTGCTSNEVVSLSPLLHAMAAELREHLIGETVVDDEKILQAHTVVVESVKKLEALLERFGPLVGSNRTHEIFSKVETIGEPLLKATYYELPFVVAEDRARLSSAARTLHLLAFQQSFFGYCGSEDELKNAIGEQAEVIQSIVAKLD